MNEQIKSIADQIKPRFEAYRKRRVRASSVAMFSLLCLAGSYIAWSGSKLHKEGGSFPMSLLTAYQTQKTIPLGAEQVIAKQNVAAKDIHRITIKAGEIDLLLQPSHDNDIHVSWIGDTEERKAGDLEIKPHDGVLDVTIKEKEKNLKWYQHKKVNFAFTYEYKTKDGKRVSSAYNWPGLTVQIPKDLIIKSSSTTGKVRIEDVTLPELNVTGTSGEIHLDTVTAKKTNVETVSGDIKISESKLDRISIGSVSGEQNVALLNSAPELSVATVSGDIQVHLPKDPDVVVKGSSMRGEVKLDGQNITKEMEEGKTLGKGTGKVEVDSLSGDLTVITK